MSRTFTMDDDLPRVPLPSLEATCARFLDWCAPLLGADSIERTRRAVGDFLLGPGPILHRELAAYDADESHDGWLDEFWRDRYLGRRDPISVNANFFFRFRSDLGQGRSQIRRAATLLSRVVDLRLAIDRGELPDPGQVSMSQLRHVFCTTRIPGRERDTVRTQYSTEHPGPSPARHAAVFYRGHVFALDVLDSDGRPYSSDALGRALEALTDRVEDDASHPAGVLTTGARAAWAADRGALLAAAPENAAALDLIETAMCGLALEHQRPQETDHALLCGSGRDRWFDLATTFIVFPDATAGLNSEHCMLDGTTILQLIDDLFAERARPAGSDEAPAVTPIDLVLTDALRTRIDEALDAFAELGARTVLLHAPVDGLSRDAAKALGCSPDAFFQLALQLAQVRSRGGIGTTYESVATRGWRNGRTEAMRVVTPELVAFTQVMDDPSADRSARIAAADAAAFAHVTRARACQQGEAPEQHLWELDLIRQRRGADLGVTERPALFSSPGWVVMRDDRLSTSSAVTANVDSWGFGATTPSCIGVAYALLPTSGFVNLSAPAPLADQMSALARELQRSVTELTGLLRTR